MKIKKKLVKKIGNTDINLNVSLKPRDFNSYGSRRGNDAVMARGTFANIRLKNKLIGREAPKTKHIPSGEEVGL